MGVLLKRSDLNWMPKSAFHFRFVNDILARNTAVNWILDEAQVIDQLHRYTFDLRTKNRKESGDFLDMLKQVIGMNEETERTTDNNLYHELLQQLADALEKQIGSTE